MREKAPEKRESRIAIISTRMTEKEEERLTRAAKSHGMSKSDFALRAIRRDLDDYDDGQSPP